MTSPAVFSLALWQVTQYWLNTAAGAEGAWAADDCGCADAACSARSVATANATIVTQVGISRLGIVRMSRKPEAS